MLLGQTKAESRVPSVTCDQKSSWTLILNSLAFRMLSGTCQRAYAGFNVRTALELNRLYRSKFTPVRSCENLNTLLKRRSRDVARSPYIVPGATMFTVTLAAPPESGRPSDGCTSAL